MWTRVASPPEEREPDRRGACVTMLRPTLRVWMISNVLLTSNAVKDEGYCKDVLRLARYPLPTRFF